MIKNTVVANVKANSNDQELRIILTEYERRLKDMENSNQESSLKLRQLIDTLLWEKDELNQRLIKANHDKLTTQGGTTLPDPRLETEQSEKKDIYIWGCGIINSVAPVDKMAPAESKASVYIFKLDKETFAESASELALESLRQAKNESRELMAELRNLEFQSQQLAAQQQQEKTSMSEEIQRLT